MTVVPATLRLRREGLLRSRAARGDAVAFAAVYQRHHQALYRYCRSILRHEEDAQDALQNTMARAFAALQDEQRDFELRPWLFRIAHNEAISILRRRQATAELGDVPGDPGELEDRVSEREQLRILQLDLADLPERQRAALVLRELNGLGHNEIGEVLALSPGAVKQAIFEARSALFSCREGREMPCHDVRRMLSDGDGRVLRGRGVRAHLRTCPDCRRFRADLQQRPRALRLLAPPLPLGSAAALLSQIVGGGTAAKLLACVAIAGTGTTVAVEMRVAREPTRPVAERTARSPARPQPKPATAIPVVASAPQRTVAVGPAATAEKPRVKQMRRQRTAAAPAASRRTSRKVRAAQPTPRSQAAKPIAAAKPIEAKPIEAAKRVKAAERVKAENRVAAAKQVKAEKRVKAAKPSKGAEPAKPQRPAKPEQAESRPADTLERPGRSKEHKGGG